MSRTITEDDKGMVMKRLNQAIKKLRGNRLNLVNIARLLFYWKNRAITRCRVIVMGVIPGFQRIGLESGIFDQLRKVMLRKPWYNKMELSWVGDFNPKMIALFKAVGARHVITHHTLRYLFDRKKEFKRCPVIRD